MVLMARIGVGTTGQLPVEAVNCSTGSLTAVVTFVRDGDTSRSVACRSD
jgi:hypothetical protein